MGFGFPYPVALSPFTDAALTLENDPSDRTAAGSFPPAPLDGYAHWNGISQTQRMVTGLLSVLRHDFPKAYATREIGYHQSQAPPYSPIKVIAGDSNDQIRQDTRSPVATPLTWELHKGSFGEIEIDSIDFLDLVNTTLLFSESHTQTRVHKWTYSGTYDSGSGYYLKPIHSFSGTPHLVCSIAGIDGNNGNTIAAINVNKKTVTIPKTINFKPSEIKLSSIKIALFFIKIYLF